MSETLTNAIQGIALLVLLLFVVGCSFAEAAWISRRGWGSFGKGFGFAALSNIIGLGGGVVITLIAVMILFMVTFENPLKGTRYSDSLFIVMIVCAVIGAPVWMLICRRILLWIMKIQTGKTAWLYAFVTTLVIFVGSLVISAVVGQMTAVLFRTSS